MPWTVASNIADRLRSLGETLHLKQQVLARRAGVLPSQYSKWVTGKAVPPQSRLDAWAEREGWPVEIFAEDGPMPSEVIKPGLQSGDSAVTGLGDTAGSPPAELAQMIARDIGRAITRAITQAHLDQSRAGLERLAETLLSLAILFGENGDDNTEILRAVQRLRALNAAG